MNLPTNYDTLSQRQRRAVREQYVKDQHGDCWFCSQSLKGEPADGVAKRSVDRSLFPNGFFNHPIHLHHDHDTGLTIGAVHCYCNAVLWQYHDQ